jgi:phage terminase large subunit GpA-like protein
MIDSGYLTDTVYDFVKPRQKRNVFASKGVTDTGRVPLTRAKKPNRYGVKLFTIGTTAMKDTLFARLKSASPGPGYMHFCQQGSDGADAEYFAQFEAERVVRRQAGGRIIRAYKQVRTRNEAIDLEVLNLAALHALGADVRNQPGKLAEGLKEQSGGERDEPQPRAAKRRRVRSRGI